MQRRLIALAALVALCGGCGRTQVDSRDAGRPCPSPQSGPWALPSIDLLFVVDNSPSMPAKQELLAQAAGRLVHQLTRDGFQDMHIGVITSSLGGQGAATNYCNPEGPDATPGSHRNDRAHLLPKVRDGLDSWNGSGFLAWDANRRDEPPGDADVQHLSADLQAQLRAAGDAGCRFQAPLEAMYRFLADPAPPVGVKVENLAVHPTGVDQEILRERKAFLRSASALVIVLLGDADDCSIGSGLGWLVARPDHPPRATSACSTDPTSACCRSCALQESVPPEGCHAIGKDPGCLEGGFTSEEDPIALRCFHQKRRFGLDLLFPTERYVNALTQIELCSYRADLSCRNGGVPAANPILTGPTVRDPSMVTLAVIGGVPWQDLARDPTGKEPLSFMAADELVKNWRWPAIVGDPPDYVPPVSPFMHESVTPRSGTDPVTGEAIAPPDSKPMAAPNGHEYEVPAADDLQYACAFRLPSPIPDSTECGLLPSPDKPLCQYADGGYGLAQYYAKAYPALRQLAVAHSLGSSAIAASICPQRVDHPAAPGHGYVPAIDAIAEHVLGLFVSLPYHH